MLFPKHAFIALLSIFFYAQSSFSQTNSLIDTFDIAGYARPDLMRKTFDVVPRVNFSNYNFESNSGEINSRFSFRAGALLNKTTFINTPYNQITTSEFSEFEASFNSIDFGQDLENIFLIRPQYSIDHSRKMFKEEEKFFEFGVDGAAQYAFNSFESPFQGKVNTHDVGTNLSLPIFIGRGRLELVNDAWHAVQILNMLEAQGLITAAVSSQQIHDFAIKISEIKNTRMTDFRLESIAEYEQLVQFLKETNYVDIDNYKFFPHLLDAWRFESFVNRLSGKEVKIGLRPEIQYSHQFSTQINNADFLQTHLALEFQLNNYQPKGKNWQFNHMNSLNIGIIDVINTNSSIFGESLILASRLETDWQLQYLPNQRTNFTLSFTLGYNFQHYFDDNAFFSDLGHLTTGGSFQFIYYVNPRLSHTLLMNTYLQWGHFDLDQFTNNNFISFSTNYRFF